MRFRKLCRSMAAVLNKVYLQVVGCETVDTTPSLLLFTDSKRYLFNCGEGTQRLFNENRLRIHKLNNIFFTRISWECIGGLPGMAMTLRDTGKINLGLYGPQGFKDFLHATRHFLYQEKLQVQCTEFASDENNFEDENISICPVLLSGRTSELRNDTSTEGNVADDKPSKRIKTSHVDTIVSYICTLPSIPGKFLVKRAKELGVPKGPLFGKLKFGEDIILADGRKILAKDVTEPAQPGPVFFIIDCPSMDYIPSLIMSHQFDHYKRSENQPCLIVHLVPMEVFDDHRYTEWKLSFGESTQHLIINKEVCGGSTMFQSQARIQMKLHTIDKELFPLLFSSEKPIHASSLLPEKTLPGKTLLKFHLRPSKLQGFDNEDIPNELDTDSIIAETINIIKETGNEQYIALLNNNANVQDLLERNSVKETQKEGEGNLSKWNLQCGMNANTNSQGEVLPSFKKFEDNSSASSREITELVDISRNTEPKTHSVSLKDCDSERNLSKQQFQSIEENTCKSEKGSRQEISTNEGTSSFENVAADEPCISTLEGKGCRFTRKESNDFQVVFIGTGASLPSKYRNVSGTLLRISDSSSILFDCGEGTLGQLYRHYGSSMDHIISTVDCIFISHIHADHHLGLIRVLLYKSKLRNGTSAALTVDETIVIGPKKVGLWLQEYSSLFEHLNYRFVHCSEIVTEDHLFVDLFKQSQESELVAVPVIHCSDAYGLVLKHVSGWKVVYSGDTRPCPALASAGQGANLLIHEATFEDELQDEALDKKHCTTMEAIDIGIKMNAGFIMLNHFSQRYPKIPVISEQFTKHTGIAFDHMRVQPRDFERIPSLFSVLNVIFAEEIEEMSKKNKTDNKREEKNKTASSGNMEKS